MQIGISLSLFSSDDAVHGHPLVLLVVADKILQCGGNSLLLNTFTVMSGQSSR